ncbi:hypothetical protein SD70_16765 [Gordoniibacillus kamchatkensis]|uniref:Spore coat protein n=1 Tax=Gordoniibacillus kamchatkensis TaxID=1590651 RepID=A0ABR5AGM9_9BACL|nr:hypothetical protein [Paenibacillus sp. VKM B-2647]KIL39888.1 hypothetical protein SD70_16765 [Paenibacillus sp. VKM B-2647]
MNKTYGLHETCEVRELAVFKTVCMTKSKTMQALVSDPDLKHILHLDAELSNRQIQELSGLLTDAVR